MTLANITEVRSLLAQIELTLYFETDPNNIPNIENWESLTNDIATYVSEWEPPAPPVEPEPAL
jgi:hypothetical protein